jgi:pilus assembly protein Flp/PilA
MDNKAMNYEGQKANRHCEVPIGKGDSLCRGFWCKVRCFLAGEEGPTAVEYAVMLSLIVVVCLTAITSIGTKAQSVFSKVANSIH